MAQAALADPKHRHDWTFYTFAKSGGFIEKCERCLALRVPLDPFIPERYCYAVLGSENDLTGEPPPCR